MAKEEKGFSCPEVSLTKVKTVPVETEASDHMERAPGWDTHISPCTERPIPDILGYCGSPMKEIYEEESESESYEDD